MATKKPTTKITKKEEVKITTKDSTKEKKIVGYHPVTNEPIYK